MPQESIDRVSAGIMPYPLKEHSALAATNTHSPKGPQHRTSLELEHLGEFEAVFETALEHRSGDQDFFLYNKRRSRDTYPGICYFSMEQSS
jgi:hypothetical protein